MIDPTATFDFPTLDMHGDKVRAETALCVADHVRYGFGSKVDPEELQPDAFSNVDCSGFFRWLVWHATKAATGAALYVPDGSWNQHRWIDATGFKKSSYQACFNIDNIIRVAVLKPTSASDGIGHILMVINGRCFESHGSVGPDDTREWGSKEWMKLCDVYVLSVTDASVGA